MTAKVILKEEDYLIYLLFTSSKSERVKKTRFKSWLITSGAFILLGVLFFLSHDSFLGYYFIVAGALALLFYPSYQRYKYKKHYQRVVSETFVKRIGKTYTIEFLPDVIIYSDDDSESRFSTALISEINEIKTHYFIKTDTGESIIVPKAFVKPEFLADLMSILNSSQIKVNMELSWKWS
jgi:hypothetical protein